MNAEFSEHPRSSPPSLTTVVNKNNHATHRSPCNLDIFSSYPLNCVSAAKTRIWSACSHSPQFLAPNGEFPATCLPIGQGLHPRSRNSGARQRVVESLTQAKPIVTSGRHFFSLRRMLSRFRGASWVASIGCWVSPQGRAGSEWGFIYLYDAGSACARLLRPSSPLLIADLLLFLAASFRFCVLSLVY